MTSFVIQSALICEAYCCNLQKLTCLPSVLPNNNLFSICSIEPALSITSVKSNSSSLLPSSNPLVPV